MTVIEKVLLGHVSYVEIEAIEEWLKFLKSDAYSTCPFADLFDTMVIIEVCEFGINDGNTPYKLCSTLFPRTVLGPYCPCTCYSTQYVKRRAKKLVKEYRRKLNEKGSTNG
jgi:hypothetical protein